MTIWLLTILLLVSVSALGFQQGAIRAGISFLGILLGVLLAGLAGKIFVPVLGVFGVKNPIWLWALPPFLGFILVLSLAKVGGFFVHQKADVYYKYKAGDLRLALWERLNSRLGACVGLLNGVTYLVLLAFVIYAFSYWTIQMASSDTDPKTLRLLNALGRDLQSTGLHRVARSVDSLKKSFYDTADLAGLLYQNPLVEARLLRYPGFLTLGERQEFQSLGQDTEFSNMRLKSSPVSDVLEQPSAKAIFANPELLQQVWDTVQPDIGDLQSFLETGKSAKYDGEKILGRWRFDASSSLLAYRRAKPNTTGAEATRIRAYIRERYDRCSIVAAPDKMVALKNFPDNTVQPGQAPSGQLKSYKGTWQADGQEEYQFTIEGEADKRMAKFEGVHVILSGEPVPVAFRKED